MTTTNTTTILAISGSLRTGSHNTDLLRLMASELPAGAALRILDPELVRALPVFDEDLEVAPGPAVVRLRAEVGAADALVVATPEYNGSVPGGLKNAIDWLSRPYGEGVLTDLPVAVAGASPARFGAVWAQQDLRRVLGIAGARVVGSEVAVGDAAVRLADPDVALRSALGSLMAELVAVTGGAAEHRAAA